VLLSQCGPAPFQLLCTGKGGLHSKNLPLQAQVRSKMPPPLPVPQGVGRASSPCQTSTGQWMVPRPSTTSTNTSMRFLGICHWVQAGLWLPGVRPHRLKPPLALGSPAVAGGHRPPGASASTGCRWAAQRLRPLKHLDAEIRKHRSPLGSELTGRGERGRGLARAYSHRVLELAASSPVCEGSPAWPLRWCQSIHCVLCDTRLRPRACGRASRCRVPPAGWAVLKSPWS